MEIKGKMMLIANPAAGKRYTEKALSDVCARCMKAGWLVTVFPTFGSGDAKNYVETFGKDYDRICAMGGDGTLNQVLSGLVDIGLDKDVAYIPAGSTNDYATTHGIPQDLDKALDLALSDTSIANVDIGKFNDSYVAFHGAFGPLAGVVNNTAQDFKNQMGYLAYFFDGVKDASTFKPVHMKFTLPGEVLEGDYIYGAFISTSTLGGGLLKLPMEDGSLSDGEFELFLVKCPEDLIEIGQMAGELASANFNGEFTTLRSLTTCSVDSTGDPAWSLDGEAYSGPSHVEFTVLKQRVRLHKPVTDGSAS